MCRTEPVDSDQQSELALYLTDIISAVVVCKAVQTQGIELSSSYLYQYQM